jgi:hypothetical protein
LARFGVLRFTAPRLLLARVMARLVFARFFVAGMLFSIAA